MQNIKLKRETKKILKEVDRVWEGLQGSNKKQISNKERAKIHRQRKKEYYLRFLLII